MAGRSGQLQAQFLDQLDESVEQERGMDLGSDADGVIHVWLHLVTAASTWTGTGAVDAGVDGAGAGRDFGAKEPRDGGAESLCPATCSSVPERPGPVRVLLLPPADSQERRLGGTDAELSVVPPEVSFKEDDDFTRVLDLDLPDGDADLGGAGQRDGGALAAMDVGRYPSIDTGTALATIGDRSPLVRWFRDGGQGRPVKWERGVSGERADQATVRQLDSNVVIDRIGMFVGRWMVDRGVARVGIVQETEIPAVGETEHQFNTIEITDQHPIPGTGVDRPVTERDACSVNVAPTGRVRPNLLNNVDKISNEHGTGADRFLVALARSRHSVLLHSDFCHFRFFGINEMGDYYTGQTHLVKSLKS